MILVSLDGQQYVDIGSVEIWQALNSTIAIRIMEKGKDLFPAIDFLKNGKCKAENALVIARSMNHIRDALSSIKPDQLVFDSNDLSRVAPWENNISPVITSCANYFTTADGKDLLAEIVGILTYAFYANTDIEMQ